MVNTLKDTSLIVFDMDGTLLDSVTFNTQNINSALETLGLKFSVDEASVRPHLGCTAEVFYEKVLDEACYPHWEAIRNATKTHIEEVMACYGKAFEGVQTTIETLKSRGIKVVLYSNCSRAYMASGIQCMGIQSSLDYTECVKDNNLPKPQLLKKIKQLFPNEKIVVVGDRSHDLEAAQYNDLPFIAARYGYGGDELYEAPLGIDTIKELLERVGHTEGIK